MTRSTGASRWLLGVAFIMVGVLVTRADGDRVRVVQLTPSSYVSPGIRAVSRPDAVNVSGRKKAEAAGAKITAAPRESPGIFRYAYIEDPWGIRIEMVEDTERLGFHHVHLRVKDPAATLAWYAQQFGGEPAKLRGRLDGVRFAGVWVFAMNSGADQAAPPTAIQLVALRVSDVDVDVALKGLAAAGVKTTAAPRSLPAFRYAFVEDPNGIRVEVVTRTTTP